MQKESFNCNEGNANENYNKLVNTFRKIVDKHAPMKRKTLRGNQAPFMTRELRKAIYNRSRLKNKQNKHPTNENRINYKKQRNKCVSLRKKAMKSYFKTITSNGMMSNKTFWNTVKPFITNKNGLTNNDITITHNNTAITDEKQLTELFNQYYVNIVETSSGVKPLSLSDMNQKTNLEIISEILTKYKDHPSIVKIKSNKIGNEIFQFHILLKKRK